MRDDELMHYGVPGMRWGVHRGHVKQAYDKATAKKKKLDNRVVKAKDAYQKARIKANTGVSQKYQKLQLKADRTQSKADKKKYGLFANESKAAELQAKADRMQYKANKYKSKYEKRQINANLAESNYIKAQRKAEKWVKAMDKTFKDYDINNLPTERVDAGKKLVKEVLQNK